MTPSRSRSARSRTSSRTGDRRQPDPEGLGRGVLAVREGQAPPEDGVLRQQLLAGRHRRWLGSQEPGGLPELIGELKMDGLSLSLHYEDGVFVRAVTRGDGTIGEDVTAHRPRDQDVAAHLEDRVTMEVRGECYLSKAQFEAHNAKADGKKIKKLVNCRNGAAGALRQKDPAVTRERGIQFMAFGVSDTSLPDLDDDTDVLASSRATASTWCRTSSSPITGGDRAPDRQVRRGAPGPAVRHRRDRLQDSGALAPARSSARPAGHRAGRPPTSSRPSSARPSSRTSSSRPAAPGR
jgi:hypothetical protein